MDRMCSETTVEDVPSECLARILSFLERPSHKDAAALTCWRWRSLDALSRRTLHFSCGETLSEDEWPHLHLHLLRALRVFPHIHGLSVRSVKHFPHAFLSFLETPALAHLRSLDLGNNSQINDEVLRCVVHGCRSLEALYVAQCNITDAGIDLLLAMCENMQDICVTNNPDIQGWGFRHGKRLTSITANFCHITQAGLAKGLQGPTCLQALSIRFLFGWPNLACIGDFCKQLVRLFMSGSVANNDILEMIVKGCPNLKQLDASRCIMVTLPGWQALSLLSLNLEYLDVWGCRGFCDQSLLAIQNGCPKLLFLTLTERFLSGPRAIRLIQASRPTLNVCLFDEN